MSHHMSMTGDLTAKPHKPSRSEAPVPVEESEAFTAQAHAFFSARAPRRAVKPKRSEGEVQSDGDESDNGIDGGDDEPRRRYSLDARASSSGSSGAGVRVGLNAAEQHALAMLTMRAAAPVVATASADSVDDPEAHMATTYYRSLSHVGERHCPTGDGFIKLDAKPDVPVVVTGPPQGVASVWHPHVSVSVFSPTATRTNPGCDDWGSPAPPPPAADGQMAS